MLPLRKTYISWLLLLMLGFSPQLLLANTTPASAPAIPAQQAGSLLNAADTLRSSLDVQLSDVKGEVFVQKQGAQEAIAVTANTSLSTGDTVKTGNGSCQISIDDRSHLTLQSNASLRITEALRNTQDQNDSTKLLLQNGKLMIKLAKLKTGSTFEVNTPTAVAVVRGTTFYLNVGIYQGKENTQMYVDESKGGVVFRNILNGKEVLVPAFGLSNAFNDGRLDEPRQLTPEQKEAFVQNFESNDPAGASQQFGIEEIPNAAPTPPTPPLQDVLNDVLPEAFDAKEISDAALDKLAEQNISELNGFTPPPALPNPGLTPKDPPDDVITDPKDDENTDTENPPDDNTDTENPPDDTGGNGGTGGDGGTDIPVVTDEDKALILEEVGNILDAQNFDFIDANQAVVQDAQTGKVFTDVHGNRVRTDQYIFHQNIGTEDFSLASVVMMSITQRSGDYQNGITAFTFGTVFNRAFTEADGSIRNLPWNDWMNIVTDDELTNVRMPDGSQITVGQAIVHEHLANSESGPDLFPYIMYAVFGSVEQPNAANPIVGNLSFIEFYSSPFLVNSDQGQFWIQGPIAEATSISASNGENVDTSYSIFGAPTATINGESVDYFTNNGSQSTGFATHIGVSDLDTETGINFFRGNDIHPAFHEEQYGDNRFLYGAFIPINDQGQVIDAPGFRLQGIRDLVHPNRLVNGGNYNLEVLFVYGIGDADTFQEQFRIDAIITPEIFSDFGLKGPSGSVDRSTIFPASLDDENQNV